MSEARIGEATLADEDDGYDVSVLTSIADIDALAEEWREFLEGRVKEPLLAHHPRAVILAHENSETRASLRVVVVRQRGKLCCIAPCLVRHVPFRLRFSVIRLPAPKAHLLTIQGNRLALAKGADADACIKAVFDALDPETFGFDLVSIENVYLVSDLWQWLQAAYVERKGRFRFAVSSPKIEKAHIHRLLDSHEAWLGTFSGRRRRKLRWQVKNFVTNASGEVTLVKVTEPDQVREFLDRLNRLYPLTWQGRSLGSRDRSTPEDVAYFENAAVNGWLRSYMLMSGNEPVAFLVGFQYGGTFDYNEIGFDQQYTKYSPGAALNFMMLEDLYAHGKPDVLSFGYGHGEYKERLSNEVHDTCSVYLYRSWKWATIVSTQRLLNRTYTHIRKLFIRLEIDGLIRRLLKRQSG